MHKIIAFLTLYLGFLFLTAIPLRANNDDKIVTEEESDGVRTIIEEGTISSSGAGVGWYRSEVRELSEPRSAAKSMRPSSPAFQIEDGQDRDESFASIVREVYSRLETYSNHKERNLRLTLSNFETLDSTHFDEIYYVDTVTFPTTALLEISRSYFADEAGNLYTVEYIPKWKTIDTDWLSFPEGRRMQSMTLKEILEEISSMEDPEWRSNIAVTRFEVKAEYEGRQLLYRAAFFWLSGKKENEWRLRPLDLITQGVDSILTEEVAIEGKPLNPGRKVGEKQFSGGDGCYTASSTKSVWSPTYMDSSGQC